VKYISKRDEPAELTAWTSQANSDWQPSYDTMGRDLKLCLKAALTREQGGLCCYCEQKLTPQDSHIEHFRPQSDPETDPLDYTNLLCSCQSPDRLDRGEPRHCGSRKNNWFDSQGLISPFDLTCESQFRYTGDGHIQPTSTETDNRRTIAARTTIDRLGLNLPKLQAMRRAAIEPFLDEELSADEMVVFASQYLEAGSGGELSPFWTTIAQLFGRGVRGGHSTP